MAPPPPAAVRSAAAVSLPPPFLHFSKLPIQSVAVSGNLVVLAATDDNFLPALSEPLIFNPLLRNWEYGPPLSAPRRWCAAGASRGSVYVASGMGSHYNTDVARSIEKLDLEYSQKSGDERRRRWVWREMGKLKDGKFSRDAIEAVGWRGKLCMVNVKGDAAKEGIIYDVETDCWEEMPEGMLAGWRGPAAAMDEETIYVVDESKGGGSRRKVCVLCADGVSITVVDVSAAPLGRLWVVDVPPGIQVVGVHILPRMIHS
ncbi:hypothetical protein DH2020_049316 [Rehmannia glutinosa]|uniref:F-box/kelch-repeat protein SKIP25 n=1 Tax=Rehmannia glutinosa TaxID=99300 RepID=A0ABR0U3S7_REHGL